MKSILKYFLIAVIATAVIPVSSCKKGENDPFLSLRSRTSRLAGVWNLSSSDYTITTVMKNKIGPTVTTTTIVDNYKFDGTNEVHTTTTTIGSSKPTTDTETYKHSVEMTVDKANTYSTVTMYGTYKTTESGTWSWLKKNKGADLKNKEAVVFLTNTYVDPSNTSTNGKLDAPQVMLLDELKNKEMIVKLESSSDDGKGDNGIVRTTTGTMTFKQ